MEFQNSKNGYAVGRENSMPKQEQVCGLLFLVVILKGLLCSKEQ